MGPKEKHEVEEHAVSARSFDAVCSECATGYPAHSDFIGSSTAVEEFRKARDEGEDVEPEDFGFHCSCGNFVWGDGWEKFPHHP